MFFSFRRRSREPERRDNDGDDKRIGGVLYCDGGVSCNVPFAPLLRERCTHALVVSLSPNDVICGNVPPGMRVACIRPSVPLSRLGVLDFSCGRIRKLISLGYTDCKRALSKGKIVQGFIGEND